MRTLSPRVHLALRLALGLVGVALVVAGSRALARKARGSHALTVAAAAATGIEARRKPNRLIREKSPYLLQHAYNPVDWYPWGEEAFATARREDKPIFLSIGYSTCHWCHVMERESFENDSVAAALNASFVAIKVDREERPDVDRVYMSAMQAMGVGGGWPLNVFLTPDLKPFFGGTYFPPRALLEVLPRVREAWRTHRAEIQKTGVEVMAALAGMNQPDRANVRREQLLAEAYRALERSYDAEQGGFGTAPKFPSTVNLNFLLRVWARDPKSNARAREMVVRQLDRMQAGGIHDCLGGGFHRYSTDRTWLVPHFEKMLYDQAQLAWAYLEGYQVTGDPRYAETARGIFAYVARDLTSPEGAFDSAEDADSEGEEGKFYVWTPDEITAVLGPEEARLFEQRYGVTAAGNFEGGASILHEAAPVAQLAAEWKQPREEVESRLARSRAKLLAARERRVRPHRDDKVLTAWNGLMISALSRGARVLSDPDLANRAARAADFVWEKLRDAGSGELHRRFRAGEVSGQGQLDDYAYYALGLVDLYEATFEPRWLERAVAITDQQIERFWDETDGGFFESPAGDASIKVRLKDGFDGAEIAGNSIAAYTLQVLANLLDRDPWRDKARRTLDYFAGRVASHPVAMPQMLVAMDLAAAVPRHVVIAGRPDAADTRALISEFNRRFLPHDLLLLADGGPGQERLAALAPFTAPLRSERGRATAYVCEHYACRLPTTDRTAFAASLDANAHAERLR